MSLNLDILKWDQDALSYINCNEKNVALGDYVSINCENNKLRYPKTNTKIILWC